MRPTTAGLFPKLLASTAINAPLSPTADIYACFSILKFGLTLREWLVFTLRGSAQFYADAAFPTLRAHAARKPNSHNGLLAAVSRIAAIQSNDLALTNMNGPYRTLGTALYCCIRSPCCGHS